MESGPLLLAGCGKMGGALLDGWLDRGLDPAFVTVVEPAADAADAVLAKGVTVVSAPEDLTASHPFSVVMLAVKPQVMGDVAPAYARFASPETVFLSIAAGKTITEFESMLGEGAAIVRSMPNTPAAVRKGVTVLCANASVDERQRARCQELLEAVGRAAWVEDEGLMDAVTAVSGSGPAYVFHLVEAMAAAGEAQGLAPDLAQTLARATVSGAGALLDASPESPGTLRQNVTSPGGTTAAALEVLMADEGLRALMARAIDAAARRSRELSGK